LETVFLPPFGSKYDLVEVVKANFQEVTWPCELIFFLLGDVNCDFGEVEKDGDSSVRLFLRTHCQFLGRNKMRLRFCLESDVSRGRGVCEIIFCLLGGLKSDLGEVEKVMFQ
jgi:hypothetical protein